MKRKFVNRKLVIAAALVAGVICGVGIKPALAGYWEEVPLTYRGYPDFESQLPDYYQGTISGTGENYWPTGQYWGTSSDSYPLDEMSSVSLWYHYASGGTLNFELDGKRRTLFRWVRNLDWETWEPDPNDNPPEFLDLLVDVSGGVLVYSDLSGVHDPSKGAAHVRIWDDSKQPGQDGKLDISGDSLDSPAENATVAVAVGKRLFRVSTNGQDLVAAPWIHYQANGSLSGDRFADHGGSYSEPLIGGGAPYVLYSAQPDDRSPEWTAYPQNISYESDTSEPTDKVFDAWISLGWKDDGVPDHPLVGFYQGGGYYSLTVSRNGQDVTLNNYQWTASPQTFVPQLPIPTEYEHDKMVPEVSTSIKNFHWDFGDNITAFPIDADVTATATDPSDGAQVSGHALIHWHSAWEGVDTTAGTNEPPFLIVPPGTMVDIPAHLDDNGQPVPGGQTPVGDLHPGDKIKIPGRPLNRVVTSVTPQPDGTYKISYGRDPDDNPDDPAYDLNQQIERAQDAYQEAIKEGATGVKYGLETYKSVAELYATGPLYELGGAALGQLGGKALELLQSGATLEEAAATMRGSAGLQRTLLARARQLLAQSGHSAEETAQITAEIKQLETGAQKLEAGASEAESLAQKVNQMGSAVSKDADEAVAMQQAVTGVTNPTLPATTELSVEKKLADYLLNPEHSVGGKKAKWFEQALGFTKANQSLLANQIVFDEALAVQTAVTEHGTKFNQTISIVGANGKTIDVLFAWIRNNDGVVRLVTGIPS